MEITLLSSLLQHLINNPDHPFTVALGGVLQGAKNPAKNLRYWPDEAPQRAKYPYAVSFIVSNSDAGFIRTPISDFEWQMMIYTETKKQGRELASACKDLFADASLITEPGCSFTVLYLATYGPMRGDNEEPYQTTVTFSCTL